MLVVMYRRVCQTMQSKPVMMKTMLTSEGLKILPIEGREQECIILSTMHSLWYTFSHFQFSEKF
jgi:hypothetical protein